MFDNWRPEILDKIKQKPDIDFYWKVVGDKRRLIGNPNDASRALHHILLTCIKDGVYKTNSDGYGIRQFPSATGCVDGMNPILNARKHILGKFFYITDLKDAYPSVDLERLALLLVFIDRFEEYSSEISLRYFADDENKDVLKLDPLYQEILSLLRRFFSGVRGQGLAVGGVLSPFLMNLYCEVYLDSKVRWWAERREIVYTRYVDDLVFSSKRLITRDERREVRQFVVDSGFRVNHRKSRVLSLAQGTVFVTKVGLERQEESPVSRLVFPQKKRRRLHGLIKAYLSQNMDWPEYVSGYIAEFLYYYRCVGKRTKTDEKTFALCRAFEAEWAKYRKHAPYRRQK